MEESELLENIPLEIVTRYGACLARVGEKEKANKALQITLKGDIQDYSDLFIEAAECFDILGEYEKAVTIYENLINSCPEHNVPDMWFRSGILYNKVFLLFISCLALFYYYT